MKTITKTRQNPVEYKVYVAKDGTEFEKEYECEDYEKNLYFKELWKTLDARCVDVNFFEDYNTFVSFKYVQSYFDHYIYDFISLLTSCELKSYKGDLCISINYNLNSISVDIRNYIDRINFKEGNIYLLGIKYSYDDYGSTEFMITDSKECAKKIRTSLDQFSDIFKEGVEVA